MASNVYLVQALRAYREKIHGQFDSVIETRVQLTQDAATEIERLQREVDQLKKREIGLNGSPVTSGILYSYSWKDLASFIDKHTSDAAFGQLAIHTFVIKESGIETWAERKRK